MQKLWENTLALIYLYRQKEKAQPIAYISLQIMSLCVVCLSSFLLTWVADLSLFWITGMEMILSFEVNTLSQCVLEAF